MDDLQPAVDDFAKFVDGQIELLPVFDLFNRCQSDVVLPSGDDGDPGRRAQSTGLKNYQEFLQALQGLVGAGAELHRQRHLHPLPARRRRLPGADRRRRLGTRSRQRASATRPRRRSGTRPVRGPKPPYKPKAQCYKQGVPDLNAAQDRTGPVIRQIKKQLPVFVALIVLLVGALGVTGYILSNQRFYLPAWVPGIGTDFYEVEAELPTAQAVVPGQGQTVNVAGVKVGEVGKVNARERPRGRRACRSRTSTSRSTRTRRSCCAPRPA